MVALPGPPEVIRMGVWSWLQIPECLSNKVRENECGRSLCLQRRKRQAISRQGASREHQRICNPQTRPPHDKKEVTQLFPPLDWSLRQFRAITLRCGKQLPELFGLRGIVLLSLGAMQSRGREG